MVFIYPPARLITPALVPLTALADALEILQPCTVGGSGAGRCPRNTLCTGASLHHTTSGHERTGSWQICHSTYETH